MDSTNFDKTYAGGPCDGCKHERGDCYYCPYYSSGNTRNTMAGAGRTQPH